MSYTTEILKMLVQTKGGLGSHTIGNNLWDKDIEPNHNVLRVVLNGMKNRKLIRAEQETCSSCARSHKTWCITERGRFWLNGGMYVRYKE